MHFKELLEEDNAAVVDISEMAEWVEVDGVIFAAQKVQSTGRFTTAGFKKYEGLHGDFLTLYFRTKDYCKKRERLPREGEYIFYNGKRYTVMSCGEEHGIAKLTVQSYRQNTLRQLGG